MYDGMRDLRKRPKVVRLSLSIPGEIAEWVRETAAREGVPASHVVEFALRQMQRDAIANTVIAGLLEDAAEPKPVRKR